MKSIINKVASIFSALSTAAFTKEIYISKGQEATLSPEALEELKKNKVFRLPFIKPSDKMLLNFRSEFDKIEALNLANMKKRFNPTIENMDINGVKVVIITPQNIKPENKDKVGLYIHPGGYILGTATDQMGMLMINEMGIKTYSIDYSMAPEAKFPVALNECVVVYKYLIQQYAPKNISAFSASAGCSHLMGMMLKVKEENLPMINSIALHAPSLDLSVKGDSYTSNDGRDLLAYKNNADKFYITPYIGNQDPTNPLISPIYGKYDKTFPPIIISVGTRDLFLSNAVRMHQVMKDAGIKSELVVVEGMWHGFIVYPDMPEAIKTRREMQTFLLSQLNRN